MSSLVRHTRTVAIVASVATIALSGCMPRGAGSRLSGQSTATAELRSAGGASHGTLHFVLIEGGVNISGSLTGLRPGAHGMHVHAVGRCDAPGFESAGPHYNPTSKRHGLDNPAGPHAGDLPQIVASERGTARVDVTTSRIAFGAPSMDSAMMVSGALMLDADGAAIVVHADADDQRTDPSGKTGARVACGVVTQRR